MNFMRQPSSYVKNCISGTRIRSGSAVEFLLSEDDVKQQPYLWYQRRVVVEEGEGDERKQTVKLSPAVALPLPPLPTGGVIWYKTALRDGQWTWVQADELHVTTFAVLIMQPTRIELRPDLEYMANGVFKICYIILGIPPPPDTKLEYTGYEDSSDDEHGPSAMEWQKKVWQ